MGSTYRFLAIGSEADQVLDWFRNLPSPPIEVQGRQGIFFHFRQYGPLVNEPGTTQIDAKKSPLVSIIPPRVKRGMLCTAGEVHFLATRLRDSFPQLHALSSRFRRWLAKQELVFAQQPGWNGPWDYYLEGSIRNFDAAVFAFPGALEALKHGHYFVADGDSDEIIDRLCRLLRLRGVEGVTEA